MRVSARAIIIENGNVLTMFRRKIKEGNTREYYVIPGGGQDQGETLEETVVRELKEELNVDIQILGYVGSQEFQDTRSHFFHCEIVKGKPTLGGEELERMTQENYYEPRFVPAKEAEALQVAGYQFVALAQNKQYTSLPTESKEK